MNHAYRVVWNASLGGWQAVSELARSAAKGISAKRGGARKRVVGTGAALTALSLTLAATGAHADNLLVGTGGAGGGNGGTGGIGGGGGGPAFFLAGGGGLNGIPGVTQTLASPVSGGSIGPSYDYVVIGGGGGGGSGSGGVNGAAGGTGELDLTGTTLNVGNNLYVGGAGGGGGAGNSFGDRGGNGGNGGNGTLTLTGDATVAVGGQLEIGGVGGAGGACGCSGNGGAGGAGVLNLGDGSTLNLTGGTFIIGGGSALNIGNATADGATAGVIVGLAGSITDNGSINFNQSDASYTFSNVIAGIGTVTQNGSGTTILTAANTYSGGTTVNAGFINFSNGGNLGTGNVTLNGGGLQWAAGNTTDISSRLNALGANGGTFDTNGNDVTMASGIGGLGGVTKTGAGTLTFTGANSYSGITTISGGTLALSGAGSIASSSGVIDNGTFDISGTTSGASIANLSGTGFAALGTKTLTLTDANGTFDGTIGGTGALVKQGSSTWTLTGANSYSGATTISGGTLALSGAGSIASSSGVIDNGTFDIGGTTGGTSIANLSGTGIATLGAKTLTLTDANGTFDGTIGGTGALVKQGAGTWTLTAANSYSGATTISGGTLALSGVGSIASSSGVIDNGTLDISGTTNGAAIANLSGAGVATLGAKTLTLTAANGTFSGTIAGTGALVKQGSGLLTFDGNSAAFAGNTTVSGGALEVGDADSPTATLGGNVNVAAAGTLRGHGTVLGDVVNGGTVAPGGSIGTLSVGGNYAQASNATLAIEVSPSGASALNVGGSATLNGVLAITYGPGTYAAKSYTLVSAAQGISGTFGSVTSANVSYLGTLTPSVAYGANEVELTLAAAATPPLDPGTPSAPVVVAPVDTSIYAAVGTSTILGAQAQGAALLERPGSGSAAASATARGWITATGSHTNVGGTNGEPGFQSNRYGFLAGLERKYGEYDAGAAVGYDHADIDEAVTTDSGTTDTLRAALYGRRRVGPVDLGATLGAGLDFLSQKRPFGPLGTAEGDHMGQEFNVGGQASLPMTFGDVRITPRVGLRYAYFHANGFGESGAGGQDLDVGTDNVRSLQPYVAVTVDKAFGDALRPVNAELRIGYAHELLDANRTLSVTSLDGTVFAAPGTSLPRGYLSAGASVTLHPARHLDVSLGYDAVINTTHVSAQQGSLQVGYRF